MPNTFGVPHRTRWLILAVFGVFALIELVLGKWGGALQVTIAAVIMVAVMWLWVPILIRQMADQHLFFLRVREMTMVFIMRDHKVHRVIIAVSGKYLQWAEGYKQMVEARGEGIEVVLVDPKHPMIYIGVPWIYTVHSWYERVVDEVNPSVDPRWFLDLNERTFDFHPEDVDTADPIEVKSKLVASLIPLDPLKMIFGGAKYYLEAFKVEMSARWRRTVAALHYFVYETKNGTGEALSPGEIHQRIEQLEYDPEIIKNAHRRLLIDTWIFGRKPEYTLVLEGDVPKARFVDTEPEAVYWDIRDPVVREGVVELGGKTWDVYGDYQGHFCYVRLEDGKHVFRDEDGNEITGQTVDIAWVEVAGAKVRKLQVKAHRRVLFDFRLGEGGWRLKTYFKFGIPKDKAAIRFYEWGFIPKDVEVVDLDPTDPSIRQALQARLKARAEALQMRERAKGQKQKDILEGEGTRSKMILVAEGQKQRDILEGEGSKERRTLEGAGEGEARRLAHEGDAAGFAAKLKALGINPGDESATMPLIAEAMERVAKATELMVMSGSGSGWSDVFGTVPALAKLWNGKGNTPSKSDLMKALANLSETERQSVIEALSRQGGAS
ncbi:MAG: hypothetical protein WCT33_03060 [Patescibacteria group bacterium]